MPELPEVETTRRGIAPLVTGHRVTRLVVRQRRLRWPVPRALDRDLPGQTVNAVSRRGKYLLLGADTGTIIIHLGMSGSLRVVPCATDPGPHDHLDIAFANGECLRLRDPRRFGAMLWTTAAPERHRLLAGLGPEPLSAAFDGEYLHQTSRRRRAAIKTVVMDAHVVAGIGNIYANEALFRAGIRPGRAARRCTRADCDRLAAAIKAVLTEAIAAGGTTLRDFRRNDGSPGYFRLSLAVYERSGAACPRCGTPIRRKVIGQRASYYCPACQA